MKSWLLTGVLLAVLASLLVPNRREHIQPSECVMPSPVFSQQLEDMVTDMNGEPVIGLPMFDPHGQRSVGER